MTSSSIDIRTDKPDRDKLLVAQSTLWTDKVIERGILFLLIFTPLAFGSVQDWSIAVMEIAAFLILGAWFIKYRDLPGPAAAGPLSPNRPTQVLAGCGTVIAGIAVLQIVPMPREVLMVLSPRTAEIYQAFLDTGQSSWHSISVTPRATLSGIVLFLSYAAVFFVVLQHFTTEERIRGLVRAIIILGCSFAVIAVLTRVFSNGNVLWIFPVRNGENAMGPFINRNHFAGYMEMIIPIAMAYYLYTAGKIQLSGGEQAASRIRQAFSFLDHRKFASLSQGVSAVLLLTGGLFISLSRGGILGYALSMGVFAWMVRSRHSLRKRAAFMALLGGVVAFTVIIAGWGLFEARFAATEKQGTARIGTWMDAFSHARDFPVFGSGWGSFDRAFPAYQMSHPDLHFEHAENEYIEVLAESGWTGLIALLGALGSFSVIVIRRWRERHDPFVVSLTIGGATVFTAIAVHSFLDFNMRVPANALLMTVVLALTCAALFKVPSRRAQKAGQG
jgi:O-antigen ligase